MTDTPATPEAAAKERDETLKAARDYVWKSFDLHFKQRNEFMRFYLTILIPIYGAYGFVLKEKLYLYGVLIAILAIIITVLFKSLDRAAQEFMWDYRDFMQDDEIKMAAILNNERVKLFAKSSTRPRTSYRSMFVSFFWANIVLSAFILLYCVCSLNQ
jgi:hypothetical protein